MRAWARSTALGATLLAAGILAGVGCGSVDDESGDEGPVGVSFTQLHTDVFGAVCLQCHVGAAAPLGLRFDDIATAYEQLTGRMSADIPTMRRVAPGDPEASYLVWKIEGREGILGGRMPLGGAPLPPAQIEAIKQWIADGAQFE